MLSKADCLAYATFRKLKPLTNSRWLCKIIKLPACPKKKQASFGKICFTFTYSVICLHIFTGIEKGWIDYCEWWFLTLELHNNLFGRRQNLWCDLHIPRDEAWWDTSSFWSWAFWSWPKRKCWFLCSFGRREHPYAPRPNWVGHLRDPKMRI